MIARVAALAVLGWAFGFMLFATTLPRPASAEATTDAIVVLTGGAGRLERGLRLLARHRARRLLVSGVGHSVRKRELAARTGTAPALFDCCVDLGRLAVDTRSNARETAAWLDAHRFRSVRLITTDWHMPRAHRDLDAALAGNDVRVLVDPVSGEPRLTTLFMEYNKYLLRRLVTPFGY